MPIVVRVDNVGAIFISENNTANSRTKHIEMLGSLLNKVLLR